MWQAEASSGVTIHRGLAPDAEPATVKWREEVALDDGKVTIHRSSGESQQEPILPVQPHLEAVREAGNFGVKVHNGTPPSAG